MTGSDPFARAVLEVILPANAPARLAPPPKDDPDRWWRIGGATWVRALSKQSVQVRTPDKTRVTEARFRTGCPGLVLDEDADWVRASNAVKGLAKELVEGIRYRLDASVPALPALARPIRPVELHLHWPGGGGGTPEMRRAHRLAGSTALTDYLEQAAHEEAGESQPDLVSPQHLASRLVRQLSVIPRPAETRLSLSLNANGEPILSWEQQGNPDLLWAASEVLWQKMSCKVFTAQLSIEQADTRRRLGAGAHLLAMATAVEATTGGVGVPLHLRYHTAADRPVTAAITILPGQWGFDLPVQVQGVTQGVEPAGLSFGDTV